MSRIGIGYEIGRFTGICAATGDALPPGSPCMATLAEPAPEADDERDGFVRADFSLFAWEAGRRPERLFSFWRTEVPRPDAPRRLLVDDSVLLDLLARLEGDLRPARLGFRFVLALILLRRRLLRQVGRERVTIEMPVVAPEGSTADEPSANRPTSERRVVEAWLLLPRGAAEGETPMRVVDPGLRPEDVASIAEQLGEVLSGEV